MFNKTLYISTFVFLAASGCTKDGARAVVVSPKTSKYNGKYVGEWGSYYSNPISSSSTRTPGFVVEVTSGYDDTHNITSISTCTYVQFNNAGFYQLPGKYASLTVRNDSLIYSEHNQAGVGQSSGVIFKGKKQ